MKRTMNAAPETRGAAIKIARRVTMLIRRLLREEERRYAFQAVFEIAREELEMRRKEGG